MAKFFYPTCFSAPAGGDPVGISGIMFNDGKTRMIGLPYGEEAMTIR